jgi:hypothetical protein
MFGFPDPAGKPILHSLPVFGLTEFQLTILFGRNLRKQGKKWPARPPL